MKAEYQDIFIIEGQGIAGDQKSISLPFTHVSSRAIILRRKDGAILGALHRPNGKYALPGGAIDDGESAEDALQRELQEEGIRLIGSDERWRERLSVDYYDGYKELSLWYVFLVDDAETEMNEEILEFKWIRQEEDLWYPYVREKILLNLLQYVPDLVNINPD
ncbi:MAG: NUDIX hydrolase [Anaerolineales bacterium]|nr:NUDIX hydrolase [Anaerolineales bacterium]